MKQNSYLSLAIAKVFEAEADAFMAQLEFQDNTELSPKTERKLRKLVKRRDKSYYPLIATAGRRVACVFAVIAVLALSALSIKPVRAAVFDFLFEEHKGYTHIATTDKILSVSDKKVVAVEVPIPEGFRLAQDNSLDFHVYKLYKNGDKYILFRQYLADYFSGNFDNEHTTFEECTEENGWSYILASHNDTGCHIIWKDEEYVFTLAGNISKEELLDIGRKIYTDN